MYNPDGSAYILEEEDLMSQIPRQEGSIVDSRKGQEGSIVNKETSTKVQKQLV